MCSILDSVIFFIFKNLNTDWLISSIHKNIYEKIYIHLKSKEAPPISVIVEQIENKKYRQKLIDLTFDLEKFNPQFEMAIDCLVRLEQEIAKNKIELLREKLKDMNDNSDILDQLLALEKDIYNINQKYDE